MDKDIHFMKKALNLAKKAEQQDEVPVGCVIVYKNNVIGEGYNNTKKLKNPLGHAEIEAIKMASDKLKTEKLDECDIYITLEPCLMCAGAILNARIKKVYYGAKNEKSGVLGSICNVYHMDIMGKMPVITAGLLEDKSMEMLKSFFLKKR